MSERGELADVLGALPESYNLTWANDEQTTSLMIDVEILADAVLESPWLRAHDDRIRAEALAPVLALADEWGSLDLADLGTLSRPTTEALVHKMAADLRAAALRAAAGTPTHDATQEETP